MNEWLKDNSKQESLCELNGRSISLHAGYLKISKHYILYHLSTCS